jgi:hypothetical protein
MKNAKILGRLKEEEDLKGKEVGGGFYKGWRESSCEGSVNGFFGRTEGN